MFHIQKIEKNLRKFFCLFLKKYSVAKQQLHKINAKNETVIKSIIIKIKFKNNNRLSN